MVDFTCPAEDVIHAKSAHQISFILHQPANICFTFFYKLEFFSISSHLCGDGYCNKFNKQAYLPCQGIWKHAFRMNHRAHLVIGPHMACEKLGLHLYHWLLDGGHSGV